MKNITATIDRIENDIAVLKIKEKTVNFPISELPNNIKEGDAINIIITKDGEQTTENKNQAKNILNEILSN